MDRGKSNKSLCKSTPCDDVHTSANDVCVDAYEQLHHLVYKHQYKNSEWDIGTHEACFYSKVEETTNKINDKMKVFKPH